MMLTWHSPGTMAATPPQDEVQIKTAWPAHGKLPLAVSLATAHKMACTRTWNIDRWYREIRHRVLSISGGVQLLRPALHACLSADMVQNAVQLEDDTFCLSVTAGMMRRQVPANIMRPYCRVTYTSARRIDRALIIRSELLAFIPLLLHILNLMLAHT